MKKIKTYRYFNDDMDEPYLLEVLFSDGTSERIYGCHPSPEWDAVMNEYSRQKNVSTSQVKILDEVY